MKILYSNSNKSEDITELVSQIIWSGSEDEIARQLELEVLNSVQDYYIPELNLKIGGFIILNTNNEKELFQGFILSKEKNSQNGNLSLVCVDALFYANKSKAIHNFSKKPAEFITKTLCNEAKIAIGSLAVTNIAQDLPANDTIFKIIKDAYDYAGSINGKKYKISMKQGKLYVEEKTKSANFVVITSENHISNSTYKETFENMINVVKIYDDTGKQIGEVKNNNNIVTYGIFQETYEKEENADYNSVAKNMLKGIEKTISIETIGNIDCITGSYVSITDNVLEITGDYTIISDTHTFVEGQHTMSLDLREEY
jgi:hypothetical protein